MRLRLIRVLAILTIITMVAAPVTAQPLAGTTAANASAVSAASNMAAQPAASQAPAASTRAAGPYTGLEKLDPSLRDLARSAVPPGAGAQFGSAASSDPVFIEVIVKFESDGSDKPD